VAVLKGCARSVLFFFEVSAVQFLHSKTSLNLEQLFSLIAGKRIQIKNQTDIAIQLSTI
jgi:hypothetical protein